MRTQRNGQRNGGLTKASIWGKKSPRLRTKRTSLRGDWACTGDACHYRGDRHIVTVGPNGSGKTRRLLIPNLFYLKDWSIVAIDPKGELFAHTAIHRAKTPGHKIVLIDPFAVVKKTYPHLAARVSIATHGFDCESQGFNPMAALDPKSPRFVDDAKALAVALIKTEGENRQILVASRPSPD